MRPAVKSLRERERQGGAAALVLRGARVVLRGAGGCPGPSDDDAWPATTKAAAGARFD
jgi:hypothetical protein